MGGVTGKIKNFFKTNLTGDYSKSTLINNVYGGGNKPRKWKLKKQSKGSIIKDVRNLLTKKENEAIKYRIIRDINNLFEKEDGYSKPVRVGNFYPNNNIEDESKDDTNKIKPYQSKNTPMKLNHTWKT